MATVKKLKLPAIVTVVGAETEIDGDVSFSAGMHVDGIVRGNVTGLPDTRSTLVISKGGRVEGDVKVENLILDGAIIGEVFACERAELASGARVTGNLHYQLLEMAMGAQVNGQLVHNDDISQTCKVASGSDGASDTA